MSAVRYRDATPDDAALLGRLGAQSFAETFAHLYTPEDCAIFLENHSNERWRAELDDPRFIVRIAESDGNAVAYAKLGPPSLPFDPGARRAIELRQFYVLKPWHGQGIAQTLMDWVLATARARDAQDMYLSVFVDNHRARRFYARYGFTKVGDYGFRVGNHVDEDHIMKLVLDA